MKRSFSFCFAILLALMSFNAAWAEKTRTITYFHHDAQGSVIAASDENGDLLWRKTYQPYGKQIEGSDTTEAISYTGKEYDADTGLMYFGARYYDPAIGRFMGIDPAPVNPANPHSFNRYVYANNNPYRYTDPDGNLPVETVWDAANVGIGVASFGYNVSQGNYGSAALDALGIVIDGVATAVPYVPGGMATVIKTGRAGDEFVDAAKQLSRYDGPKPTYHVNPAHVPGQRGFNSKKTPLPNDAEDVFKNAVPNDPNNPTAWFGKNGDGQIYRFSASNDGTAHFSGIDGVGDGIRNISKYAQDRLNGL